MTLNACRIELRSRASRERRHEAFRTRGPGETFDVPDPDPMLREWLGEALGDLPEPTRRSILLRVLEGLSYREIAEREGATVPAVKMRVARGLRTLRARIQLDGAIETEVGREESREACVA